ncbi:pilus assembly protein N-terminal domain-containing protein [Siccirubricoccus deserti]
MFTGIRICPAVLALGVALLAGTASAQAPPSPAGRRPGRQAWLTQGARRHPCSPRPSGPPLPSHQRRPPRRARRPSPLPISVLLQVGAGRLLQLPQPALTVLAADPRIARVQPASPTSLFVMAVGTGRTTVIATAEDGTPVAEYDITVQPGPGAAPPQEGPRRVRQQWHPPRPAPPRCRA